MSGATRRLGVIGYPVRHSISPAFQQAALDACGIPARYERYEVSPEELPGFLARVRGEEWLGVNVTIPHKEAVVPLLDTAESVARAIGSVNTVWSTDGTLGGCTTDNVGFLRAVRESGYRFEGTRAVVIGTGGTSRAVAVALLGAGVGALVVLGRSRERAEAVRRLVMGIPIPVRGDVGYGALSPRAVTEELAEADLLVNTTPVGMLGGGGEGESSVPAGALHGGLTVFDAVYNPVETPLLRQAREAGARTVTGLDMLVYQGAESFRLWTGVEPPIEVMKDAARRAMEG